MQVLSIGREKSNDIVLSDPMVSRKHAELSIYNDGNARIKDLGSSNGLFVNGNRVTETTLQAGDVVKCGPAFLNWGQYVPSVSQSYDIPESRPQYQATETHSIQQNPGTYQQAPSRTIIIANQSRKSTGLAFILAFFFGPLGLLYSSVIGGVVMFIISIPVLFFTAFIGAIVIIPACVIWAMIAVNQHNEKTPQIQQV